MPTPVIVVGTLVKDAVVKQLKKYFEIPNEPYYCYAESIPQNFKRPSFFVTQVHMSQERKLGLWKDRFERFYRMRIQWFPPLKTERSRSLCLDTSEKLLEHFRWLEFEDYPVWGRGLEVEIIDEILYFTATYRMDVYIQHILAKMMTLDLTIVWDDHL